MMTTTVESPSSPSMISDLVLELLFLTRSFIRMTYGGFVASEKLPPVPDDHLFLRLESRMSW
jgi:hypothetical protein